jgi:hypothetical protein
MAAAVYNFFIEQGSDFEINFVYQDSDQNLIDTSEYCARLRMLDSDGNVRLYTSNVICTSYRLNNDNSGTVTWKLPAATTASYKFTYANYELHLISSTDQIRIATGRIEITQSIFSSCPDETLFACKDCDAIVCADSNGQPLSPTPTPTITSTNPTQTPTINPCETVQENLCDYLCKDLDMFATLYSGTGLTIYDDSLVSGTINIPDTGIITNVEVSFAKLKHTYPQDLKLVLAPPSGDKILLSYHNKIGGKPVEKYENDSDEDDVIDDDLHDKLIGLVKEHDTQMKEKNEKVKSTCEH